MKGRRLTHVLAGAFLTVLLAPPGALAAGATTHGATAHGGVAQPAPTPQSVAADVLREQAQQRAAPRKIGVNQPEQVSFETGDVQQVDITPDGKWLAATRLVDGVSELWLRPLDPSLPSLPRRLAPALADRLSPALSPDGRAVAFVGTEDDAKGDIYLLDLTRPDAKPVRLTGRDTEDGAPRFAPDGRTLYFHQRREGETVRRIVALDVSAPNAAPRFVSTGGDAACPAVSPDGRRLAFISTRDGGNAVYVMALPAGPAVKLTPAGRVESAPRFAPDGSVLCVSGAQGAAKSALRPIVVRVSTPGGAPLALTSAQYAADGPLIAGGRLYFLSARSGPVNLWSLPPEGEIPDRPAAQLLSLADTLAAQTPLDRRLTILAYGRAAEAAGGTGSVAARALYAQGRQYEGLDLPDAALAAHGSAAALGVQPESGLSRLRGVVIRAAQARGLAHNDAGRRAAADAALKELAELAAGEPDARVRVQAQIERARLLATDVGDSGALAQALRLLDAQSAAPGRTPEQAAEALYLKAETYSRIGQIQAVLPLYARVIAEHPTDGPWADRAIGQVIDQTLSDSGKKLEDRAQALVLLAERYRASLPKLALGAENRLGDVYYAADEWAKAKDAYRQTIAAARSLPQAATQLAAARLALAEILYREERFHQALDLYETEMAGRPYEDRLYRLAKAAYLRKSVAAGDYLLRIGEVPSAQAIFGGLLRENPDFAPAHRGLIRAAAALHAIPALAADYRQKLAAKPDDPTLLYALGLTLTYEDGKAPLTQARRLIARAIRKNGQVEYFHQTLGYIDEVLETVHHERGRLESALESYQRARFLNARGADPDNAANLDLNIGNVHFLLGQYPSAFAEYQKRLASKVAFDNPETEILFYERLGAAAFQARAPEEPITAYTKALELVEKRIEPKYASVIFGRIGKFAFDRVLTPAEGRPETAEAAKKLAERQSALNTRLFEASIKSFGPPPDPAWNVYVGVITKLLSEQKDIDADLPPLMKDADRAAFTKTLAVMEDKVREALGFPPRFVQLRAELYDRLGLAQQEVGHWHEARLAFEKALALNTALGLTRNLVANQRSAAYDAFMEAGLSTGAERDTLLDRAAAGFRRIPELVAKYGVANKRGGDRKGGLINLSFDVAVNKGAATQASYGFSAAQEKRIAESFLARIAAERGRPRTALDLVERQSRVFETGAVAPQDAFGAGLLLHRAGLLENSLGHDAAAFERFRRSAELALDLKNPLSASRNVMDMAAVLADLPADAQASGRFAQLRRLEARAAEALRRAGLGRDSLALPAFADVMAAHDMAFADRLTARDATTAAERLDLLSRAGQRLAEGRKWFADAPAGTRRGMAVEAALELNRAELARRLGEEADRASSLNAALDIADKGLLPAARWRALAGLGRLEEALDVVRTLPPDDAACGPGEITRAFAPLVADLVDARKPEQAYNLLERLAELERVGRMSRLGAPQPSGPELALLRRTGLRLLTIRDLTARLAAAVDDEKAGLRLRLDQEREILAKDLGTNRELLPGVARLGADAAQQDELAMLFGLSAELSATADSAVAAGTSPRAAALRQRCAEISDKLAALRTEESQKLAGVDAPGASGLFLAAPSEAIDLLEALPKGVSALRLALLPGGRWVGFRLDKGSVSEVELGHGPRPALPALAAGKRRILLFEAPELLAPADRRNARSLGLSGTYMVRCLRARKPFRRNLVFIADGDGQTGPAAGTAFAETSLSASSSGLPAALDAAHTVAAAPAARLAASAPSRQDETAVRFLALMPKTGEPLPLAGLAGSLRDASLAVFLRPDARDLPLTAQLLALYGVPSVLAPLSGRPETAAALSPFLAAYAHDSAADAANAAPAGAVPAKADATQSAWMIFGDPGLNAEQAQAFAATQFARYVRAGVADYKAGRAAAALARFENALRVTRATRKFDRYLPDLLAYSRESAYAAGRYDKALVYAQKLADRVGKAQPDSPAHAEALVRLGLVHARLEQYAQAAPILRRAADMLANLSLAPKEIEALSSLGAVLENSIHYDRALASFESAAKVSQKAGATEMLVRQYENIGRIYDLRLAQYPQAKAAYAKAYELSAQLGRTADMAQALLDMGRCARLSGDFATADAKYAAALKLVGDDKAHERLRLRVVLEQANNAWQQARFQQAFDLERTVLKAAEKNGWTADEVMARNTAGLLWWSLGDHERAVREFDAALPLAKSLRIRQDEVATTLNNRGLVERDMGKTEQALKTLREALSIDRNIRSRWAIAYDLRNIAQTYTRTGEAKKALPLLTEALGIVSSTGNRINETKILLAMGEADLALRDEAGARAAFAKADGLAQSMDLRDSRWRALHGLARIALADGERPKARALLEQAVGVIEAMRAELKVDQLKDGFIADKSVVYEDLVTLLADMGDTSGAFRTAERSRARNLIDLLGNTRRNPKDPKERALFARIAAARNRLREQESLLAGAQSPAERAVYSKGVQRLKDEYHDALLEMQAARPDLASLVSVNPLGLAEVQKLLEPGVGLLSYYVTASEVFCWAVDHDHATLARTRIGRDALNETILAYRRTLQNLEPAETYSKRLYDLLVAPALPHLAGVKTLGIVPHGALHTLSFATLTDGRDYLVDRYPLFQLPSASVFRFTLARRKAERNVRVLAVGNPDLRDKSLELPFAEREVRALAWDYPNMTALTRKRATKDWITQHIGEFGIIHMATHGEFDPINPLFSALKLAGDKKNANGDLEAAEIFDLRINADLIVLSACQTGLGQVSSGDEVKGLNQAFLYAGTHALVSSLWRVSDISTAMLMKQFYRELQTRSKAESLRRAMLHVKNRFPHPGYWGAFTLTGDYK